MIVAQVVVQEPFDIPSLTLTVDQDKTDAYAFSVVVDVLCFETFPQDASGEGRKI